MALVSLSEVSIELRVQLVIPPRPMGLEHCEMGALVLGLAFRQVG